MTRPPDDTDAPLPPDAPAPHDGGALPPARARGAEGTTSTGDDDDVVTTDDDDVVGPVPDDAPDGEGTDPPTTPVPGSSPAGGTPTSRRAAAPRAAEDVEPAGVVTDARGRTVLTSPVIIGLLAGAQAVLGSLLCVVAPVVATWLVAAQTGATWDDAVRVAADGWLLAHGAELAVAGGRLALWPLGLALVPLAWYVSAGRRTAVALEATHPAAAAPRDGLDRALLAATGGVVVAAAGLAAAVAIVAGTTAVRPGLASTLVGAAVLSGLGAGAAMAAARLRLAAEGRARRPARGARAARDARRAARAAGTVPAPVRLTTALADLVGLPPAARGPVAAGGRSLLWGLVGATAVLVVALVAGADAVGDLQRALDAGVVGGAVLLAGQALLLPTALVWALSWVAGPGFAVGAGTSVSPGGTELAALPALPLLGGLPEQGTGGGWLWVVLLLPVAAGAVASLRLRVDCLRPDAAEGGADGGLLQRLGHDVRRRLRGAALRAPVVGLVAGSGAGLLAAASSGAAGPGSLAVVGPVWWEVAGALGGLVALGSLLALLAPVPRRGAAELPAGGDDGDATGTGEAPQGPPEVAARRSPARAPREGGRPGGGARPGPRRRGGRTAPSSRRPAER